MWHAKTQLHAKFNPKVSTFRGSYALKTGIFAPFFALGGGIQGKSKF